ncbi:contractile injection system protein, VgrG/Pvc8 family [Aggregatibacter actinomycetemcomitans]|uniref:contractile injection system protein, VgrG/Pvc8 family n=2 Tax=Aggregatibacter actinomycetemcomitans TaxID=714 RepID=UPI0021CCB963|nr:contractile injection system protein, VgrG/Pvc8 family [Aggregatibacter actinomycetemcomitans]
MNGIVTGLGVGNSGFVRTYYHMVVEPALVRSMLQSDSRIFQHQNSEKIIRTLLQKSRVDKVAFAPLPADWEREYCVQYRETDFAFIERLAAEEGWYYYFAHNADSHELRFAHQSTASPVSGTLTYNGNPAGNRPFAGLWQFEYCRQVTTTRQALRDYTFLNPNYNLEHQHSSPSTALTDNNRSTHAQSAVNANSTQSAVNSHRVSSRYEKYDYPGRYQRDEQGKQCSRYRLEAEIALSETANATGDDMRVIPGYGFTLEGHINPAFNQDWLVVGVEHTGRQTGVLEEEAGESGNYYENRLFLIPHHTLWRSPQKPRPIIRADPESRATAEEKDRLGAVFKEIWQELDAGKDGSGGEQREARFEAGSLKQLLTNPLTGRRLTGIVVRHKSEWSVRQAGKFEELKALIRKHKCAEEAERLGKRIADLGIRLKGEGFDSEREAYYFHPLGMIGWLSAQTDCILTKEQFSMLSGNSLGDKYIDYINNDRYKFNINNCVDLGHFIAQMLHESGNFVYLKELGGDKLKVKKYWPL